MIQESQLEAGRLTLMQAPPRELRESFADAVRHGLSQPQKELPSRFFYDACGSELFERITELPEYYLTRCEQSILEANANEIVASLGDELEFVEFGSGSSKKTRLLIEAALENQGSLHYTTIDISAEFGRQSALNLLRAYPRLEVTAIAAEYFEGVQIVPESENPRMFLFLGSNIGNFEEAEAMSFLKAVRNEMQPADGFLVGIDLDKDPAVVKAAYNDSLGITAEFNKNVLARINRELGGHFVLSRFIHQAPYIRERGRVEMRLVSDIDQDVEIEKLGMNVHFKQGEYIHTENSRKFKLAEFNRLAHKTGFEIQNSWFDPLGWFGLFLLRCA